MKFFNSFMLFCLLIDAAIAAQSMIQLGNIERTTGGREYTIALTGSDIQTIRFFSNSTTNREAKIKITSASFYNGYYTVDLLREVQFATFNPMAMSFDLSDLSLYPVTNSDPTCQGACLVINAEAFGANDLSLNMEIESLGDRGIWMRGVSGMASHARVAGASNNNSNRILQMKDYAISYEVKSRNLDGSVTFKRLRAHRGDSVLRILLYINRDALCRNIGHSFEKRFRGAAHYTYTKILTNNVPTRYLAFDDYFIAKSHRGTVFTLDTLSCF